MVVVGVGLGTAPHGPHLGTRPKPAGARLPAVGWELVIETLRVTLPQLQPLPSAIEQWECFKRLAVNVLDEVQEFFPTPVQKISTAQQFDSTTLSSTLQDELETIAAGRPPIQEWWGDTRVRQFWQAIVRRTYSPLSSILNRQGTPTADLREVGELFCEQYTEQFAKRTCRHGWSFLFGQTSPPISPPQQDELTQALSPDAIRASMAHSKLGTSPGPDRLTSEFYRAIASDDTLGPWAAATLSTIASSHPPPLHHGRTSICARSPKGQWRRATRSKSTKLGR